MLSVMRMERKNVVLEVFADSKGMSFEFGGYSNRLVLELRGYPKQFVDVLNEAVAKRPTEHGYAFVIQRHQGSCGIRHEGQQIWLLVSITKTWEEQNPRSRFQLELRPEEAMKLVKLLDDYWVV